MSKKLIVLVNKYTSEVRLFNSKTALAEFLNVSLSTIMRRYKELTPYNVNEYVLFMNVPITSTSSIKNYKTDVIPPIRKTETYSDVSDVS